MVELFAGKDIGPMQQRMQSLMAEAGLPYSERSHTFNSRLAQELGKWAESQPKGDAIHIALFRAYFVDKINLHDIDCLLTIAENIGLNPAEARAVLEQRLFKDSVDADWQRSRQLGINSVPTFYANDLVVVGSQPYEVLQRFMDNLIDSAKDTKS